VCVYLCFPLGLIRTRLLPDSGVAAGPSVYPVPELPQSQPPASLSVIPAALLSLFTPACHIPVISEGATYLFSERQLQAGRPAFLVIRTEGGRSVRADNRAGQTARFGNEYVCLCEQPVLASYPFKADNPDFFLLLLFILR